MLKPGGRLLNFDANWYGYLYDEEKRKAYEQDRKNVEQHSLDDHYLCTDIDAMEQIALQMPLSAQTRPGWDTEILKKTGFAEIHTDTSVWERVWSKEEKLNYGSTPMFMINGRKVGLKVMPNTANIEWQYASRSRGGLQLVFWNWQKENLNFRQLY